MTKLAKIVLIVIVTLLAIAAGAFSLLRPKQEQIEVLYGPPPVGEAPVVDLQELDNSSQSDNSVESNQ